MEGFEVFTRMPRGRPVEEKPKVSITHRGDIVLNAGAVSLFEPEIPEYVLLLFHPKQRIIALKPTTADDPNAYKLRHPKRSRMRIVGAKPLLDRYGIPYDRRRTFDAYTIDEMVAFKVTNGIVEEEEVVIPRRRRRRSIDEEEE